MFCNKVKQLVKKKIKNNLQSLSPKFSKDNSKIKKNIDSIFALSVWK